MTSDNTDGALLKRFTPARVALGRSGGSLATPELLALRLAHARARDALLRPLNEAELARALEEASKGPVRHLESAARSFNDYLLRPELGRMLDTNSEQSLSSRGAGADLVVIVSEGLSTLAAETHSAPVIGALLPLLRRDGWNVHPVCLVRRARVAIQDHVGECVKAEFALILIGERPGLNLPDSLGAYLVRHPTRGNTVAQRNCVSDINRNGLSAEQTALKLHWLLTEGRRRQLSGIALKDEHDGSLIAAPTTSRSHQFLQ